MFLRGQELIVAHNHIYSLPYVKPIQGGAKVNSRKSYFRVCPYYVFLYSAYRRAYTFSIYKCCKVKGCQFAIIETLKYIFPVEL